MSDSLLSDEICLRSEGEGALLFGGDALRRAGGEVTLLPGEVILLCRRFGAGFLTAKDLGIVSLSCGVRWSTHFASKLSISILQ